MKPCLTIVAIASACATLIAALSCSHVQRAADDVCAAAPDVIALADKALGSDDYDADLAKIAAAFCAVRSAVEQVTALAGQKAASKLAGDPIDQVKYSHGTTWLATHVGPAKK